MLANIRIKPLAASAMSATIDAVILEFNSVGPMVAGFGCHGTFLR